MMHLSNNPVQSMPKVLGGRLLTQSLTLLITYKVEVLITDSTLHGSVETKSKKEMLFKQH
jgi:hypothetical protein